MKKVIFTILTLLASVTLLLAQSNQKSTDKSGAKITAEETDYNFGTIKEVNGPVSHVFVIKNEGDAPLVITRATASCGCTKPEYSGEPIAPGETTNLKVTFNPAGRAGQFVKTVSVYSNGKDGSFILRLIGVVE